MPKFRRTPNEVTAVQWKGEVTPELRALFGTREITVKPTGDPLLVIHTDGEPVFAEIGDWVVRTDYEFTLAVDHGDPESVFDLDVMEPEDFGESYELAEHRAAFALEIPIPAKLIGVSGEADAVVRVQINSSMPPTEGIVAPVIAQLLPHLKDPTMVIGCVQALCLDLDPDTLVAVRDAVERIMVTKSTHH